MTTCENCFPDRVSIFINSLWKCFIRYYSSFVLSNYDILVEMFEHNFPVKDWIVIVYLFGKYISFRQMAIRELRICVLIIILALKSISLSALILSCSGIIKLDAVFYVF